MDLDHDSRVFRLIIRFPFLVLIMRATRSRINVGSYWFLIIGVGHNPNNIFRIWWLQKQLSKPIVLNLTVPERYKEKINPEVDRRRRKYQLPLRLATISVSMWYVLKVRMENDTHSFYSVILNPFRRILLTQYLNCKINGIWNTPLIINCLIKLSDIGLTVAIFT